MKLTRKYIYVFFLGAMALSSCTEDELGMGGEGQLALNVALNDDLVVVTKAESNTTLEESAIVKFYSQEGLIRKYEGLSTLPPMISLKSGEYSVKIQAGDSVESSFDKMYFKGYEDFTIVRNDFTTLEVPCKIANSVVTVAFEGFDGVMTNPQVSVAVTGEGLVFNDSNLGAKGYFMMPNATTSLKWILTGEKADGSIFEKEGVIANPKQGYQYDLTYSFVESEGSNNGGLILDVEVDESEVLVQEEVILYMRPAIEGVNFKITEPQQMTTGYSQPVEFLVMTTSALESFTISSALFPSLGFTSENLSFIDANEAELDDLKSKGIDFKHILDTEEDRSRCEITFTSELMAKITANEGVQTIEFAAFDENEKSRVQNYTIVVSNALVQTLPLDVNSVWTNRATIRGRLLEASSEEAKFNYRALGETAWNEVPAIVNELEMSAELTGLQPSTVYQYTAVLGEQASSVIEEFTTEASLQVPNNSFEQWSMPGKIWLIYGSGENMFWDSGNHGSATMNKNVTEYDETIFNSGGKSVKMQSQFVGLGIIGKFAAGNMFAGEYLKTDGTDGILGFGRPFESRPTKVRGYYKYNSGKINYSDTSEAPEGSQDKGFFYVALGDWKLQDFGGKKYPVIIKTKASERQLFDKEDPAIIAYTEMTWAESSAGDGMVEFELDLDYRTLDRKPTHIVVVASASKYGDFFTGSSSSTLWMDDIELIYE